MMTLSRCNDPRQISPPFYQILQTSFIATENAFFSRRNSQICLEDISGDNVRHSLQLSHIFTTLDILALSMVVWEFLLPSSCHQWSLWEVLFIVLAGSSSGHRKNDRRMRLSPICPCCGDLSFTVCGCPSSGNLRAVWSLMGCHEVKIYIRLFRGRLVFSASCYGVATGKIYSFNFEDVPSCGRCFRLRSSM